MNRRVCVWIGSVLGCLLGSATAGIYAAPAVGQATPPVTPVATVPPAVQSAADASVSTAARTIRDFMVTQVAALQSGNRAVVTAARVALLANCPRTALPSPSYRTEYGRQFAAAAGPLLVPTSPLAVRINIGVVTAELATVTPPSQLEPLAAKLLADRSDAVVLQGVHAAKPMVIDLITRPGGPGRSPLFGEIVAAVRAHPAGGFAGPIAVDAYKALIVNPTGPQAGGGGGAANAGNAGITLTQVKPLIDPVLDLFETRIKSYANGIPPEPGAEAIAPTFFTSKFATPGYLTVTQKQRVVVDLIDLIDAIGQRVAPVTDLAELTGIRSAVEYSSSGLNVLCDATLLPHLPLAVPGPTLATLCQAAYGQVTIGFSPIPTAKDPTPLFPRTATSPGGLPKPPTLPPLPPTTGAMTPPAAAPPAPAGAPGGMPPPAR